MIDDDRPLLFSDVAHRRASDQRKDPDWVDTAWRAEGAVALVLAAGGASGGQVAVDATTRRPLWSPTADAPSGERYLLGIDEAGVARFAVHCSDRSPVFDAPGPESPGSTSPQPSSATLRELALAVDADEAGWLCHAVALVEWHATHTHCPRCGSPTEVAAAGAERRCPVDDSLHFPRVDPAVIVLVTDDDDRALLGRQGAWPEGRFSTLAGFVEPGESAEHAIRREVDEESGVTVTDVELVATQPWPFPSSLMVGATARAYGRQQPVPDGHEVVDVRWFSRAELLDQVAAGTVLVPGPISISRWLIDRWMGEPLPDSATWR